MKFAVFYVIWFLAAFAIFFSQVSRLSLGSLTLLPFLIIGLVIAMFIPWIIFWTTLNRAPAWKQDVLENGRQASATVIGISDTGISFGRTSFVIQMRLQVRPPDEAPFEATLERTVSRIDIPTTGDSYLVKYDPNDKSHILLVSEEDIAHGYGTMPAEGLVPGIAAQPGALGTSDDAKQMIQQLLNAARQGGAQVQSLDLRNPAAKATGEKDVAQELAQLAELHKNGDLNDAEFDAAKKKLLG